MKRCGILICAVLLLCQQMLLPVAAETPEGEQPGVDVSTVTPASETELPDYADYAAANDTTAATASVTIEATGAQLPDDGSVEWKNQRLCWGTEPGAVTLTADIPADGWYAVSFEYIGLAGGGGDIEIGLQVDGAYPYAQAERFMLPRIWQNDGAVRTDTNGNEFAPEQIEVAVQRRGAMRDVNGFITEDLGVYLTAGVHAFTVNSYGEPFGLAAICLDPPAQVPARADWLANAGASYTGEEFAVEGEAAVYKSDRALIGLSDNSDPGVQPADAFKQRVNYIGGGNWSMPDETLTWTVTAPQAGVYKMGVHFRQNYLINATSYRSLKVKGKTQYAEQAYLAFDYKNNWQFTDRLADGNELLVYLDEGENELSLSVTLGLMSDYSAKMESLVLELGDMYRDIVAIVGESPDSGRDYELFDRVPDLEERMKALRDTVASLIEERRGDDKNIDDSVAMLKKIKVVLEKMLSHQYEAQKYKNTFYDGYSSLSAWLQEMKKMALDIDALIFTAPGTECRRTGAGFGEKTVFGFKRFLASFLLDYNTAGGVGGDEKLTLWVNWSRDQTLVLNSLINSRFTPETGISVTVRMTNASLLQGIMSGNGPDCALSESRTTPVNLAMRGALKDLSAYPDYEDVRSRFIEGAEEPYKYNGGVYALPSTQQFYMMFCRTDVLKEYGLSIPKTWEQFIDIAGVLMLHNMQVGLPYTQLTDIYQTNGGVAALNIFPSLLLQHGLSLYNADKTATSLGETETIRVFEDWTNYYTRYSLPQEYSFFNRFRVGLMPLAIQSYAQYSVLSAAAPEITGRWEMAEIPGVLQEDGTISNGQAGFGTGSVILEQSDNPEAAWKLLKWWTSADTQYRYALDIESILGVAGRYTSANTEAMLALDWGREARLTLTSQWNKVQEIAEIPGGYYVSRAIDQAFWNVVSQNENPKDMMKKWGEVADNEIETKIRQYSTEEAGR